MRPIMAFAVCFPYLAVAQDIGSSVAGRMTQNTNVDFQFGGAAMRSAIAPVGTVEEDSDTLRPSLTLPLGLGIEENSRAESPFGPATIFVSEGQDAGREIVELGTFLSRGQARAGVSVTYIETDAELARSELFLDYALTEQFSVGVSGSVDATLDGEDGIRRLGLNAEYSTSGGAFVQGGFAGVGDADAVIGLSIGLRF